MDIQLNSEEQQLAAGLTSSEHLIWIENAYLTEYTARLSNKVDSHFWSVMSNCVGNARSDQ